MGTPKLVIFDCDGILVDTENLANQRLAEWLSAAGFTTTLEYCRKHFSGRSMVSVQQDVEATGVSLGADFVERWNAGLPDLFAHGVEAIPYVREFIEKVRAAGIDYCVASSARVSKMHITLGQTGLLPLFEHAMFSSTMVGRGKPFPDLFLHAATTMGFAPADCIVIEDSVAGTEAGIAAGMRVFSYHADPYSDPDGLAGAGGILFDDMRELAGLVPIH
ncbi:HAD family hydrolase [Mesorhizobium amorphae]|uniref:HAD-superfamily hydrolase n=1 Tax=Mesorhizobium amorphae CCNWGS0123 TaxID=1082933 RepID=G6YM77_9HYPH|nr:HAD family phosphatase [Mesorhizobium amorphae]ANT49678.1 HAD family hydrolase [Mesorhizobium amorphae CCNWGS0123]EHH02239.1 HAD-superfamily hydrolase [Mesorhizobium amorphae CCNWGS0123]GLR40202.1 haloacid dehalogenase [Mesorhizobium amorphae]